jgi:hypothetical protein
MDPPLHDTLKLFVCAAATCGKRFKMDMDPRNAPIVNNLCLWMCPDSSTKNDLICFFNVGSIIP